VNITSIERASVIPRNSLSEGQRRQRSGGPAMFSPFDFVIIPSKFYPVTKQTQHYNCLLLRHSLIVLHYFHLLYLLFKSLLFFEVSCLKFYYHMTKLLREISMLHPSWTQEPVARTLPCGYCSRQDRGPAMGKLTNPQRSDTYADNWFLGLLNFLILLFSF
jgi:hypothetical protein